MFIFFYRYPLYYITVYFKVRPANTTSRDISTFFSPPLSRTNDIPRFLRDLQVVYFLIVDFKFYYFYKWYPVYLHKSISILIGKRQYKSLRF